MLKVQPFFLNQFLSFVPFPKPQSTRNPHPLSSFNTCSITEMYSSSVSIIVHQRNEPFGRVQREASQPADLLLPHASGAPFSIRLALTRKKGKTGVQSIPEKPFRAVRTAASSAPAAATKWNTKVNGVGVKGFANESTAKQLLAPSL